MRRLLSLLLCLAPALATAQTASLVADSIAIEGDRVLVAEGNVEVLYEDARLTASRVTYDRESGAIGFEGPLVLTDGEDTIILADAAELDPDLRAGVLRSARLVLNRQLQLAAAQIDRDGRRYTRLSRVVASSCQVCEASETPLWEIRARRVIRDEEELQLYFDDAQFRLFGVPILYFPRLRLPDPTLERATGFVVPTIRSRSQLGFGIRVPYFIRLGDHADLTFAPYVSGKTTTLEARYRHELPGGTIAFEGAVSQDDLRPGETRAYLFANGSFDLPRDFTLRFDAELVSDTAYLLDYGYSEKDRLESGVTAERTRDDQIFRATATSFRTLRAVEVPTAREQPNELLELQFQQRLFRDADWGDVWLTAGAFSLSRPSSTPGVGRDVSRLNAALGWQNSRVLTNGIVADIEAEIAVDRYLVAQDPAFPETAQRMTPAVAVGLRWPHERIMANGVRHLIEPTLQLAWADSGGDVAPNEDSTVVEFDEANLFGLSRFPGVDRREEGLRANVGVTWTRYDPRNWSIALTVGRVFRFDERMQFGADTGLSGTVSDWLVALNYALGDRLDLLSRSIIEDNLDIVRSETRLAWRSDRAALEGTHLWRAAEPSENRFEDLSELTLGAAYRIDRNWTATADWRYDADASTTTRAGLGLRFENECLGVDLSLSRRFTSSTSVDPSTEFDLRVFLTGFGTGGDPRLARRSCRG